MRAKSSFNVLAAICILFGILFLLENYGIFSGVYELWPVFPLILGWGLCLLFFKRSRRDLGMLGMGVFLICISLVCFYYNFTSWSMIASTWPAFIGSLGLSFLAVAVYDKQRYLAAFIGLILVFLCATFILVFSVDERLWPISLILFGVCIYFYRRLRG